MILGSTFTVEGLTAKPRGLNSEHTCWGARRCEVSDGTYAAKRIIIRWMLKFRAVLDDAAKMDGLACFIRPAPCKKLKKNHS